MTAVNPVDLRNNQKEILDLAYGGDAEYLNKLEMSMAQAERGEVVMYTKEQMRAMEEE